MTTHSQRALILYRRRRFINHLLTYLLTLTTNTCSSLHTLRTIIVIYNHDPLLLYVTIYLLFLSAVSINWFTV